MRSWSLAAAVGRGDACPPDFRQERHRRAFEHGGQLLFLFFQPLRRRDEILDGPVEIIARDDLASLASSAVRLAASTMLSMSAPLKPVAGEARRHGLLRPGSSCSCGPSP